MDAALGANLCKKSQLSASFPVADVEMAFSFEHWMQKSQEKNVLYLNTLSMAYKVQKPLHAEVFMERH